MDRPQLPLNSLRAFETAARQGSFVAAAVELCVTPAAVSHHVKALEERLGVTLFQRTSRGLVLSEEGTALLPVLEAAFDRIGVVLDQFLDGSYREVLNLGVVATFAAGWLVERLPEFSAGSPGLDVRISTNNNRSDLAREGLTMAIRFGDGRWRGEECVPLMEPDFSPLCAPSIARRLHRPDDLARETLFRSYRADEWSRWFEVAGSACPVLRGPVFDSSFAMSALASAGLGVALLPVQMFSRELDLGHLVRPFPHATTLGRYWLTWPQGKSATPGMERFKNWLARETANPAAED